jgi:hypothetical protein
MAASTPIVVIEYSGTVASPDGRPYVARACGRARDDGKWEGWIEFTPVGGGAVLRSRRETTQPALDDLSYWASGLSDVYLAGALERALTPPNRREPPAGARPAYDGPAPDVVDATASVRPRAVLDPFAVYVQGEDVLRQELSALDAGHLVNIVRAYGLSGEPSSVLDQLSASALVHLIVDAVRAVVSAAARERERGVAADDRDEAT